MLFPTSDFTTHDDMYYPSGFLHTMQCNLCRSMSICYSSFFNETIDLNYGILQSSNDAAILYNTNVKESLFSQLVTSMKKFHTIMSKLSDYNLSIIRSTAVVSKL